MTKKQINEISYEIIGAAIEVHKALGPGLLEQIYETCLEHELLLRGLDIAPQKQIQIEYKGFELDAKLRCDLLVEDCIVVELKAIQTMNPVFVSQLLSYMNLLKMPKGILFNFFCTHLNKEGQQTFVNEYFRALPD